MNIFRRKNKLAIFLSFSLCLLVVLSGFEAARIAQGAATREHADLLVSGGTVITMDAQRRVLDDGAVVVRGDTVVAVGPRAEVEARFAAARQIDARGNSSCPG
jgi:DNA integrity scanning protein DisA with diadenylate cyclase activity